MTTIRLLDARRGLNLKCRELFKDEKIAEGIYRFLCDGIEECEDAEPERKGRWERHYTRPNVYADLFWHCSVCGYKNENNYAHIYHKFCPNCGAKMEGAEDE